MYWWVNYTEYTESLQASMSISGSFHSHLHQRRKEMVSPCRPPESRLSFAPGDFPSPIISAVPSPVILWNVSVKILCQGTPESYLYQLVIPGNSTYKEVEKKLGIQELAAFTINRMDTNTAGYYQCPYRKEYHWSGYSEALQLVVKDSMNQDYTMENLIQMGITGLVLVALLAVLAENQHSHQAPPQESWKDVTEPSWSKQKCQAEWNFGQIPKGHSPTARPPLLSNAMPAPPLAGQAPAEGEEGRVTRSQYHACKSTADCKSRLQESAPSTGGGRHFMKPRPAFWMMSNCTEEKQLIPAKHKRASPDMTQLMHGRMQHRSVDKSRGDSQ
ncbi:PREDICTED: immunoglobulin alpha Fc receptor-like, partial [Galeopterus variegatus]|uniref:immunoglobulin alpha Fc receptor-like n=1 Tax=Galeopterus variegatus TaxID=482537 RepID=UPI0004D0655E